MLLLAISLLAWSCEKEKEGTLDPDLSLPYLSSASLNHSSLNLDTDSTGAVVSFGGNRYRISIAVSGQGILHGADFPSGGQIHLLRPGDDSPSDEFSFDLRPGIGDTILFNADISFEVQRSEVGELRVEFYMLTPSGNRSNSLTAPLLITRRNSRPVLSGLVVPDTIVRPSTGSDFYLFAVAASDSDGYGDIREVFFKRITPAESAVIDMYDDGDRFGHGDQIAGDGVFSRIVRIDSLALLGPQMFLFMAKDNSNALSDSLMHTITILP